jgi:hypothetical protein
VDAAKGENAVIKKGKQPITGARPQYSRKRPYIPDAKDTSLDEERFISEPPTPFKNNQSNLNGIPAGTNPAYRANSAFYKDNLRYGGQGRTDSVKNKHTVNHAAVGYDKGPYQSKRGLHSVNSGYPTNPRNEVGDGNFPKAIKVKRFQTNTDIFNPRVLHEAGLTKL